MTYTTITTAKLLKTTEINMGDKYDFEGKTKGDILLSFKSNKGHRTRQFNKITNLLALQEQKYSKKTLLIAVKEMEK